MILHGPENITNSGETNYWNRMSIAKKFEREESACEKEITAHTGEYKRNQSGQGEIIRENVSRQRRIRQKQNSESLDKTGFQAASKAHADTSREKGLTPLA